MLEVHKQELPEGYRCFCKGEVPFIIPYSIDTDETLLIKNELDIMRINIIEVETGYAVNAYIIMAMNTCLAAYETREDAELVKEDLIKALKDTKSSDFYFPVDKNLINAIDICRRQAEISREYIKEYEEESNKKIEKFKKDYEDCIERRNKLDIEEIKEKYFDRSLLAIGIATILNIGINFLIK